MKPRQRSFAHVAQGRDQIIHLFRVRRFDVRTEFFHIPLPKRGEWVFAGAGDDALTRPAKNLANACAVAGVDHVSLHGLRRSFKSLTEWLEVPVGVVAQIQGHKPSATAEKHYTVRPLELLRLHHEKIEAWMLEHAGIVFVGKTVPGAIRLVAA